MKKILYLISTGMLMCCSVFAQQTFAITDKQPALVDGLELGYTIKSTEVKAVSGKGDFSRYSVSFYVRNTTNQGKIMLYKQGWNVFDNVSDQLAQFNCLNATGARLTTKEAIINAEACNVLAKVSNNNKPEKQFVQIGYWIKPGQTISTGAILITPLNELPNVQVTYLAAQLTPLASASIGGPQMVPVAGQDMTPLPPPQQPADEHAFIKLKNNFNNTYLNNQQGPPQTTNIESGWWSAQWEVDPVPGGKYMTIKNRWKENFLYVDQRGYVTFTDDYRNRACYWAVEPTNDQNVFRFKNLMTGGYLSIAVNGALIQSRTPINNFASGWLFEQP